MKKNNFLPILFVFGLLYVQAQNYTTNVDNRFKKLSKSTISSNILIDRVFSASGIPAFNQGIRKDTSSFNHFKQAWSELYRASYSKNFPSITNFKNQLNSTKYSSNTIPIGIINTEFHQANFGTTAQNANVNFNPITGEFTNKPGKNPFKKKQTTIIAPLKDKVSGPNITFLTNSLFKLHKKGKRIKHLRLYANNTSFSLINNYVLSVKSFTTRYSHSGLKYLRFVITFSDNTVKTTYGSVYVSVQKTLLARNTNMSNLKEIIAHDDLTFKGYDETRFIKGKNEYRIYYATNDAIVRKPLYIIDGYDPGDKRKIERNDPNHESSKSIRELMSYKNGSTNIDLIEELNSKGYDVIIVNHILNNGIDGGSDYIERNAYTFISLLREIKQQQEGNEKAVVIGPSMGGLISRYALAYMEKKLAETGNHEKWDHNTRLWVSFDAPHQGANIPIGVQKGIQYFADELEVENAKDFIKDELNKPAPKQMLVNHLTNNSTIPVGAAGFRDRFVNSLNALGMPKNLRKIALVNGPINGTLNGIPKSNYLQIDIDLQHFLSINNGIFNTLADKVEAEFRHSTNDKSGSIQSLVFQGGIKGSFLGLSFWLSRNRSFSSPYKTGSYDVAPGSFFNAHTLLADESEGAEINNFSIGSLLFTAFSQVALARVTDKTHGFIPSKSALAYIGRDALDENLNNQNLVCGGKTPFESYYVPDHNQEHIFLTPKNVAWLTEEIMGNPQEPTVFVTTPIVGSTTMCYSNTNYTIALPCQISNQWSVSNNLRIVSQTNNSITVRPVNSSTQGHAYIKSKVGSNVIVKNIWIGKPLAYTRSQDPKICANVFKQDESYILPVSPGADSYRLTSNSPYLTVDNVVTPGHGINISASRPGNYRITLTTRNSCGSQQATIYVTAERCGDDGGGLGFPALFSAYPNPVSETLTIQNRASEEKILSRSSRSLRTINNNDISNKNSYYEVYNFNAKLIEKGWLKGSNQIDVSGYKKGKYIIRISTNDEIESHVFIVN
ncbi:T9SS type A sorting domain-containing protein [Tenacibaculum agarivorans]|uniref:T9SS type A sorting domain-containing protein n=1 Tax=Tenacibaculum agarivorans TaxID=1908389 RepID=UPI00094B8CCC|nr:T9SS type A sorting domain-containing protein [Tenacibaculum agarivorans]